MTAVVGREHELSCVERLLSDAHERYVALALEGEAGIGKTTIWREALRLGGSEGFRVLSCRPAEAEAKLAFASLADFLAPVDDEVFDELPEPQREALDVALLKVAPRSQKIDPRAVATALTSVVDRIAETSPIFVAIDDAQWLDRPSAGALSFALRRIDPNGRVALLVVTRTEEGRSRDSLGLEQFDPDRLQRIQLGPLTLSALYHALREQLGLVLPRPILQRVERTSGGNPLFALEIARLLRERGLPGIGEPLPVPSDLEALITRRVRGMPPKTREVLIAAALLGAPRRTTIGAALARAIDGDLEPAERAELVRSTRELISFTHPLFASAILSSATSAERRRMHRRLAAVVAGLEERARHIALATEDPDEDVAALAHSAAREALYKGAPAAAAELAELALHLTPPGSEETPGRLLDLAKYLHAAGEPERARAALNSAGDWNAWRSDLRTELLDLFALFGSYLDTPSELSAFFETALDEPLPREAQAAAHISVSYSAQQIDAERALEHAEAGLALLESLGEDADPSFAAGALATYARARLIRGHGLDEELVRRAVELEARLPREQVLAEPTAIAFAYWFKWLDDVDRSREWLTRYLEDSSRSGYEMFRAVALVHLSHTECLAGNLQLAREHALSAAQISDELDIARLHILAETALARVETDLGNVEAARAIGQRLDTSEAGGVGFEIELAGILGLLELAAGNDTAADTLLQNALAQFELARFAEPGQFRIHADGAEAAVAVGDLERAKRISEFLQQHGERTGRRWSLATGARVTAIVAAANGELQEALTATEEALRWHVDLPIPIELGRTLLLEGMIKRRLRRRADAKKSFERALTIFEETGARLWGQRARAELARTGLRRSPGDELTASERRVAELTAKGMTRREVAAALYVSPKTVDATLVRVYRKLGVRSRAELGARMAAPVQR